MKYLFTLCLLIVSLSGISQWQQTGSKVRYVNGLGIPTRDTAAGVLADSSQILIRPADSSLYVKYKRTWLRVGGGTVSGTPNRVSKFTGATTVGNSSIVDSASAVSMTINPAGNIGIGTITPNQRLDLRGASGLGLQIYETSSGNDNRLILSQTGTESRFTSTFNTGSGLFTWVIGGGEVMRITSGGNVGINQNAPAGRFVVADGQTLLGTNTNNGVDRLQVSGSIISSSTLKGGANGVNGLVVNSGGATGAILNNIATSGGAGFDQIRLTFQHLGADRAYWYYSNTGGQLVTSTALTTNDIVFAPGNSSALYMKAGTQNVVISNSGTDNSVDKLQVNGSIQGTGFNQAYTAKTGTYTAATTDYFIDCTSGTFTVNLFTAVGNTGRILIIKNSGTGTITVDPNGSQTIDGATTQTLSTQWSRVHIISDGANWKIISN